MMFGKSLIKLFGMAIAGAIALVVGVQLIGSATAIVLSLRYGDIIPFLLVTLATVILLRLPKMMKEGTSFRAALVVIAYGITGYLVLVVFILLLPFGVVASLTGSSFTLVLCSLVHDPAEVQLFVTDVQLKYNPQRMEITSTVSIERMMHALESKALDGNHVFQIRHGDEDKIVEIVRNRPLLPISITKYEDFSIVAVSTANDTRLLSQVRQLLSDAGIDTESRPSSLFLDAILKLPIIDAQFGLPMKEFCFVSHPETVECLLENWPTRMTAFPTLHGPCVILPRLAIPGIVVKDIPSGFEFDTLMLHDYSALRECVEAGTNTT